MIALPVGWVFCLALFFNLAILLGLAAYYALRERRTRHADAAVLFRCAVCGHVYEEAREVPMARCTRCGRMNEAINR